MTRSCRSLITLLVLLLSFASACRRQQLTATDIQFEMSSSGMLVGDTTLLVKVSDREGQAIENPGRLTIRGDMDHAGMAPVFAQADAPNDGVFTVPFAWTMGGRWIVEARLTLENGEVAKKTFQYEILTEAKADGVDHGEMDHADDMDHSTMRGESSAVYMRIANRGDADVTILSVKSAAAARIEFHRTIIENDTARMEALRGLRIPAGETVALEPGGAHIMLMALSADLMPDTQFTLQLTCEAGEVYDLDIPVAGLPRNDLDAALEIGDLVFSNRWARPARKGSAVMNSRGTNSR